MLYRIAIPILLMPVAALAPLASAPEAHATITSVYYFYTAQQDAQYVSGVLQDDGLFNALGPAAEAQIGRQIACDIESGTRNPPQEQKYVFNITPPGISQPDANVLVNVATEVYLQLNADWLESRVRRSASAHPEGQPAT